MQNKKNCILYLVRASEDDLTNLNKSLALIDDNLLPYSPGVDLLLFVEDDFEPFMERVIKLRNGEVTFVPVKFPEPPEGTLEIFPHPIPQQVAMGNLGFSIGYRHMCWFFSGGLYEQPIMDNYKYYMRLDTDSYILSPVGYELFDAMEKGKYKYATIREAIQLDHPDVCIDLWNFCWRDSHNIPEREMFYTNWEMGEVDFFSHGLYYAFFKRIEEHGGIYRHRWGDGPVKRLGVGLLTTPEQIMYPHGFVYCHGATYDLR